MRGDSRVFFDSNVLVYLIADDEAKAAKSEQLLKAGGAVSVQVLNEFVSVARRKNKLSWIETHQSLASIRATCRVVPLTLELHEEGLRIAERYGYSIYDSMILSAAIHSGCDKIYSEDFQHGQSLGTLSIQNPFL